MQSAEGESGAEDVVAGDHNAMLWQELVEVVDYDYQAASHHNLGEFVLFKEFYSTGVCSSDADSALSVTRFSRDNFHYTDKGDQGLDKHIWIQFVIVNMCECALSATVIHKIFIDEQF